MRGTAIHTDPHAPHQPDSPPDELDPLEIVALLEAHLAQLNTHLALNTMALAAFGLQTPTMGWPEESEVMQ